MAYQTAQRNENTVLTYVLITALYFVTGGTFSNKGYSIQITLMFALTAIICLKMDRIALVFQKQALLPLFLMAFFVMLVPLLHPDSISTYIGVAMQIAIGFFCAAIIPPESFKEKYINVIVFFASISLVGYVIGIVYPSFAKLFPFVEGMGSVDYYNAWIYVFMRGKLATGDFALVVRNSGICWEPGCYQMFLNVALFFLLDRERDQHQKRFSFFFFILVITILTTVSTTGLIILAMLLVLFFRSWFKNMRKSWLLVILAIFIIVWLANHTDLYSTAQYKLNREFGEENKFIDRISLDKILYLYPEDRKLPYFFGMSFAGWLEYDQKVWNSVIHSFLALGIPFTIIQLVGYFKGSRVLAGKKYLILLLIMIMSASTETLFWRVLFDTFAAYGWIYQSTFTKYMEGYQ